MDKLFHKLIDMPHTATQEDWHKEASLFYDYMLEYEDKIDTKINKIFNKFKREIDGVTEPESRKQKYDILKMDIFKLGQAYNNNTFDKALNHVLVFHPIISDLQHQLESIQSQEFHINSVLDKFKIAKFSKGKSDTKSAVKTSAKAAEKEVIKKSKRKAELVARNAAWNNTNESRLDEFRNAGFKYKTTYHRMDDRTGDDSKYYASLKQVVPINEPFFYNWNGYERVFQHGPDRPNDRSIVSPYIGKPPE